MVVVILTDISAQKEAELQLYQVNQRLICEMDRLRQRNRDMLLLNQMGDLLQTCQGVRDAYDIVALIASQLFVGQSGVVYIYQAERNMLEMVAHWGDQCFPKPAFGPEECQVFQQNSVYTFATDSNTRLCQYAHQHVSAWMLCVPLLAQNEMLGVFHLCSDTLLEHATSTRIQQLAETVASHVAMALNNLILRERLREQAIHDALTGLFNRHYLNETLTRELKRAARQDQPVALMILDIDYFKHFNDDHGHDAGDTLLRMVGAFLRAATRGEDIACRYGGEEFILVLPGATLEAAYRCAENVRLGISSLRIQHHDQFLDGVTVSIGVAVFPEHGLNDEALIKAADRSLYRAKAQGRNCVVVAA